MIEIRKSEDNFFGRKYMREFHSKAVQRRLLRRGRRNGHQKAMLQ